MNSSENITLSLKEAVAVAAIRGKLCSSEYKLLAEWLDCYDYVIPAERKLEPDMIDVIHDYLHVDSAKKLFRLWLIIDWIESCLTIKEQERILEWTLGSSF